MNFRLFVPSLLVLSLAACGGDDGKSGQDGFNSLTKTSPTGMARGCDIGGLKLETGLDTNRNGVLDSTEVQETTFLCSPVPAEQTPSEIGLAFLGRHSANIFAESAAEIVVFDPGTQRAFVVNAHKGQLDVLDVTNPTAPGFLDTINVEDIATGAEVNSVAIHNGIVAVAIEAAEKTDPGFVAFYNADDLSKISHVQVGALPDMLTFTPDGKTVLVANEGEPNEEYSIDPEGSVSIIDVSDLAAINQDKVRTADFKIFNSKKDELVDKGVRIFGPGATVAQDVEPEYIAVSGDGKTAWAALQENNAVAVIDIEKATVTDVIPLGFKDHGVAGYGLDVSDGDRKKDKVKIEIGTWPGLKGIYHPDGMVAYEVAGKTYLVTANEGDARAWGEDAAADAVDNKELGYFGLEVVDGRCNNDTSKGYIEEWRVKHLVHKSGFDRRCGDDLPGHLRDLAAGALLNPDTFGYCGAEKGDPGDCRDDFDGMGRLLVTWTMGYQKDESGNPVYYTKAGDKVEGRAGNPETDYIMYDELYAFGARSFAIWDPSETGANGSMKLVHDSGDFLEKYTGGDDCMAGSARNIPCKDYFNSNHSHGDSMDRRSVNKGPEPEGLVIGQIGNKHFLFLGLERMGGVMTFDVTNPEAPVFQDYINTRENWVDDPEDNLSTVGDLGIEGLFFVPAHQSPSNKPLVITGNEVSGTTAVYEVELK